MPAPGKGGDSGMAWATDTSGSASLALAKIHQIDAKTGEIIKTRAKHISGIESNGKGAFWCGGEGGKLRLVQKTAKS